MACVDVLSRCLSGLMSRHCQVVCFSLWQDMAKASLLRSVAFAYKCMSRSAKATSTFPLYTFSYGTPQNCMNREPSPRGFLSHIRKSWLLSLVARTKLTTMFQSPTAHQSVYERMLERKADEIKISECAETFLTLIHAMEGKYRVPSSMTSITQTTTICSFRSLPPCAISFMQPSFVFSTNGLTRWVPPRSGLLVD